MFYVTQNWKGTLKAGKTQKKKDMQSEAELKWHRRVATPGCGVSPNGFAVAIPLRKMTHILRICEACFGLVYVDVGNMKVYFSEELTVGHHVLLQVVSL